MNYIGENDKVVSSVEVDGINNRIMIFDTDKRDTYLQYKMGWDVIEGDFYHIRLGASLFSVPTGFYVLIGDEYGEFDFILVDEMFNRGIDVVTLDVELKTWSVELPYLDNFSTEVHNWPMTKHIVPIQDGGKVMMISERDHYHKLKMHQLSMFTAH